MKHRSPAQQARVCGNPHCRRRIIYARGRCQACYAFLHRHGRDATPADMRARREAPERCQNCRERPVYARGQCKRCYQFRMRTGRERPSTGQKSADGLCRNCGRRPAYRLGRCRGCYGYLSLHRKDRVED